MEQNVEDTEKRSLDNTFLPMTAQKQFVPSGWLYGQWPTLTTGKVEEKMA